MGMVIFEDIQDVEEWMATESYATIWDATAPWGIFDAAYREHCDELIAEGTVDKVKVLAGLRHMVRLELTARFGLADRVYEPVNAQYLRSVH